MRLANLEALKRRLGDGEEIPYADLLHACKEFGAARTHAKAAVLAGALNDDMWQRERWTQRKGPGCAFRTRDAAMATAMDKGVLASRHHAVGHGHEPVAYVHDVSYLEGYDAFASTSRSIASGADASEPAKKFPFQLDPFQAKAIRCLDNGESVMVSAHTSVGKTVVALYAIAMSLRNQQRVIYMSPIKALSNQKYREFKEEFSDVGLMTGDVTIEPNAPCLVMTTEIWRSMQYKGFEVMREVAWIIYLMRCITCGVEREEWFGRRV